MVINKIPWHMRNNDIVGAMSDQYREIGQYIVDHADTLAANTDKNVSGIEFVIRIPIDGVTTLEQKVIYFVLNNKEDYHG